MKRQFNLAGLEGACGRAGGNVLGEHVRLAIPVPRLGGCALAVFAFCDRTRSSGFLNLWSNPRQFRLVRIGSTLLGHSSGVGMPRPRADRGFQIFKSFHGARITARFSLRNRFSAKPAESRWQNGGKVESEGLH